LYEKILPLSLDKQQGGKSSSSFTPDTKY
jgi:hypothetical protein